MSRWIFCYYFRLLFAEKERNNRFIFSWRSYWLLKETLFLYEIDSAKFLRTHHLKCFCLLRCLSDYVIFSYYLVYVICIPTSIIERNNVKHLSILMSLNIIFRCWSSSDIISRLLQQYISQKIWTKMVILTIL